MKILIGIITVFLTLLSIIILLAALTYAFWYCWPLGIILSLYIYAAMKESGEFETWKFKNIKRKLK